MSDVIIVGLLSLAGTVLGTFGGIMTANKLTNYRIEQLEKKVDKHNSVVERVFKIEGRLDTVDEKIDVANHRIKDLEGGEKTA
nr:MAG TPA: hemolysin [Caudoviricetes sp.]